MTWSWFREWLKTIASVNECTWFVNIVRIHEIMGHSFYGLTVYL